MLGVWRGGGGWGGRGEWWGDWEGAFWDFEGGDVGGGECCGCVALIDG